MNMGMCAAAIAEFKRTGMAAADVGVIAKLGLHFSPRRLAVLPGADEWAEYPVMTLVIQAVELAREREEVYPGADALRTAQFFLLGLYVMLITSHDQPKAVRMEILDNFLATVLRGVQAR
jgi:hypothetical protein